MYYRYLPALCVALFGSGTILLNVRFARNVKAQGCNQRIWHYYAIAGFEFVVTFVGITLALSQIS
jgi:hypothetical protein